MATTFAVPDGRVAMAATTYTGTGATLAVSNAVNTVGMQPDLVWIKSRSNAYGNYVNDVIRGSTTYLETNTTGAEGTQSNTIISFNSNGFSLGNNLSYNGSGSTYVGWQWNAGGTTVTNGTGTISSQVRANTPAGFSVVTYTGTGTNATVGHGLGVAPSLVICKTRAASQGWAVYHISSGATQYLLLNSTIAATTDANAWNNTAPTSSVFSVSIGSGTGGLTSAYVAYCWAPVAGYSAFGSYTGNGSADGPFIYTGFRPRFILIKVSSTTGNWRILDTARSPSNVESLELYPSLANAESSFAILDGLSNGFKIRNSDVNYNNSGSTYIYACFAENPLRYANAR